MTEPASPPHPEARTRVLYLCSGNPLSPSAGMDVVVRLHLLELSGHPELDVRTIFVSPGPAPASRQDKLPVNVQGFSGDEVTTARGKLLFRKLRFVGSLHVLGTFGFKNHAAQKAISQHLSDGVDVIVIDHSAALANVRWLDLLRLRRRVVYIAHDNDFHAFNGLAMLRARWSSKGLVMLQAAHAFVMQAAVVRVCRATVFISEADRAAFNKLGCKGVALCPVPPLVIDEAPSAPGASSPYVLFIGSPGFAPNAFAIDWLIERLAPALSAVGSALKVALVGKGTDRMPQALPSNMIAHGFLSDEALERELLGAVGLVSPVIHGGGIKVKIVEALSRACPVFATAASLRGFEFMEISPKLDIDRPEVAATCLASFASDQAAQLVERRRLASKWNEYQRSRNGKLAQVVLAAAPTSQ